MRARVTPVVVLLLLTACGSTSTVAGISPAASASPAGSPSPSPSPVASLPCDMHGEVGVDQGGYRALLGTITLPAGTITVDPNHHIIGTSGPGGSVIWSTDTAPQLYGNGGATFSKALSGWLPAAPELVAADGLHYAYQHVDGTLRLADSAGQEVIVPNPNKLTPIAYTAAGVVLVQVAEIASNGLWLLDPTSHAITPITAPAGTDDWLEVRNGVAWGVDSPGVLGYAKPIKLLRAAVQPGAAKQVAFTAPTGDSINDIAVDTQGGVMIILVGSSPGVMYMAAGGAASPAPLRSGIALDKVGPRHRADAHGIWFLGQTGIFLFTASAGLQGLGPALQVDVVPGGDCV